MDDGNVRRRQRCVGIVGFDAWIVPLRNLSQKDIGNHVRREMQWLRDSGQVVGDHNGAKDGWEVNGEAIRAALVNQDAIAGARLVTGSHVRIR